MSTKQAKQEGRYPLGSVKKLPDGRYRVERRDGAGLTLEIYEWQEVMEAIEHNEMFLKMTTGRQVVKP